VRGGAVFYPECLGCPVMGQSRAMPEGRRPLLLVQAESGVVERSIQQCFALSYDRTVVIVVRQALGFHEMLVPRVFCGKSGHD
jgi:hypothetical protein